MRNRIYHGWIIVEDGGPGMNPLIYVEWREKEEQNTRNRKQVGFAESGCANAVEWWEKRLDKPVKLQPALKGSYRVYTEK